jgi:cytochrome c biogenesis protein CcmG, thiol:disulfide interchange protein DsbE
MSDAVQEAPRRRRVAPFIVLAVAVALGALFVVLAQSSSGGADPVQSYLVGRAAPAAAGTTLDGEPFDLGRRKGSWVVLNFFDPTCIPCIEEHPELVAFAEDQAAVPGGAELYTIINRGSDDAVRTFFVDNGGDWPIVKDPTGAISVNFGVAKVPETWVIDPNGVVRVRYPGTVTAEGLSTQLQQLREGGL